MRQYIYTPADVGLVAWPPGELRLPGIEITLNPNEADLLVYPAALSTFGSNSHALERLPYLDGRPDRLVCFDCSDFDTVFTLREPILIRCNLKPFMRDAHPRSIAWPWPVDDFQQCMELPPDGFQFDVSFHGWLSTDARRQASESCRTALGISADIAQYVDFCGYIWDQPEGIRRRSAFEASMRQSRLALCPESIPGVLPYRFFEAMSAGRVPLLVGTGYSLPFPDKIPWADLIVECPAAKAESAAAYVESFVGSLRDGQIVEMGQQCRSFWARYLNREDWPRRMTEEVLLQVERGLVRT